MSLVALVAVFTLSLTSIASAQRGRNAHQDNKIEASIGWRGDRDLGFIHLSSSESDNVDFTLSGGFEFMAFYRPWTYLHTGMIYTNYANGGLSNQEDMSYNISQSQFGLSGFLATPWTQVSQNKQYQQIFYRVKIGGVLDATGLKVSGTENENFRSNRSLGRLREHRFFASTEVGIKCFGDEGMGIFFLRMSYMRSVYSFSGNGSSLLEFDSGNNDRITFDIGLSL
ncbi:MAG: hypothetical protein Q8P20_09250 [bacterium]|nr:hypothetical protein [bacterium]